MNLHNVRFMSTTIGMWLSAHGRNGRSIGTHIWMVPEGQAPEVGVLAERPNYMRFGAWRPNRFNWRPFSFHNLFSDGYVSPICGHRSASASPRIQENRYAIPFRCQNCARIAIERGIIVATSDEARELSAGYLALHAEHREWEAAGRPDTWPIPN